MEQRFVRIGDTFLNLAHVTHASCQQVSGKVMVEVYFDAEGKPLVLTGDKAKELLDMLQTTAGLGEGAPMTAAGES